MSEKNGEAAESRPWFRDSENRVWHLSLTAWHLKTVRERTGVDLGKLLNDGLKPFHALVSDPITFVDVLWILCEEQAKAANVTDEDFGRSLAGDPVEEAGRAFEAAYLLFCPSRTRKILTPLLEKARAAVEAGTVKMVKAIEELDLTVLTTPEITTPSASNAPGSAELTPPG